MSKTDENFTDDENALAGFEKYQWEFYQDRIAELSELDVKLEEGDYKFVSELAHRWKGFSAPYGFSRLEKLSIELEEFALDKNMASVLATVEKIKIYLAYKKSTLKESKQIE